MSKKPTIQLGEIYYLPASTLGITTDMPKQMFKVQIHKVLDDTDVIVLVKHYQTKKCDKITLKLTISSIVTHGSRVLA